MKTIGNYDIVIVGAGIIGICAGIAALEKSPHLKILILEKCHTIAKHASGRNSGVLHAGFYYSPESLKARFCRDGNSEMKQFAKANGIPINHCGKVIVAKNETEASRLVTLFERGITNGIEIDLLPEADLVNYEPTAKTKVNFIWSPTTAVMNPTEVLRKLLEKFMFMGGKLELSQEVSLIESNGEVHAITSEKVISAKYIVNAAGAQSDLLARKIGVGLEYCALPFKGIYRKTNQATKSIRLIYPVPHPVNPFLGVHTTITMDGFLKIGPTAIPALGRENYVGFEGVSLRELLRIITAAKSVATGSKHDLFEILRMELPLLFESRLRKSASVLSTEVSSHSEWTKTRSGIRSQLVNIRTGELVQDFRVEKFSNSLHFLNVVSPGWTSALPFTRHFVNEFIQSTS